MRGYAVIVIGPILLLATAVTAADGTRAVGDRQTQPAPIAQFTGCGGTVAGFSENGKLLLTAGAGSARVWDVETFKPITGHLSHVGKINVAVFNSAATAVLTAGDDGKARVWDVATGKLICEVKHDGPVVSAEFSRDGKMFVTGSDDKTARVWDAATGKQLLILRFDSGVYEARFNSAGDRILTMAASRVSLFDRATGKLTASEPFDGAVSSYAIFSPDGSEVASAREAWAWTFDAVTGKEIAVAKVTDPDSIFGVNDVAFSPDGKKLATATAGFIQLWDPLTGKPLSKKLAGQPLDYFQTVAFSRDGSRIFAGGNSALHDNNVWAVWDANTGKLIQLVRYGHSARGYAISPDGTRVAGGGAEVGDTAVWKIAVGGN